MKSEDDMIMVDEPELSLEEALVNLYSDIKLRPAEEQSQLDESVLEEERE